MRPAYHVEDVRAAERALMATLPEGTLMQRAAAGLARRCALILDDQTGGVYGRRVHLLVGSGDNGGDALYAGAMLADRGAAVSARLLRPDRVHKGGLAALRQAGGRVTDAAPTAVDVVVDGIVGIGGRGGLRPDAAAAFTEATRTDPVVVAVDVPSGVDVDTGNVAGDTVIADVTVTFGCLKPAHVVGPAAPRAGHVELVDIGLELTAAPAVEVPERRDVEDWWPRLEPSSEKYLRGVVGIATGSATYPGAAVLGVGGALAGPTGMVRYVGTARDFVLQAHPSVICTEDIAKAGRVEAWVCGSGLGTDGAARKTLRTILDADVPAVFDADALTILAEDLAVLSDRARPSVVTPHDREFARLAGGEPGADRVEAARDLAARTGAVVLLKGDRTVVATPEGRAYANPTGTSALATGGTGDVLAGLLGSLLAAGVEPAEAAAAAAYVHGLAGREAARGGPVTAADVVEALKPVVRDI